ncbi:hypothetical protein J4772_29225 [Cohnella sp. LGH]|uniref:hypothetical protein n=1 Tax=Cohnella sp. LGH TaxID=1619153 RepID=UPI001ADCC9F3|nr:hypothetical protein [Cohnella sp. LGH]QTH41574.1 hypothetical protein J4772_29225 [Cohnella sp. LGH]
MTKGRSRPASKNRHKVQSTRSIRSESRSVGIVANEPDMENHFDKVASKEVSLTPRKADRC